MKKILLWYILPIIIILTFTLYSQWIYYKIAYVVFYLSDYKEFRRELYVPYENYYQIGIIMSIFYYMNLFLFTSGKNSIKKILLLSLIMISPLIHQSWYLGYLLKNTTINNFSMSDIQIPIPLFIGLCLCFMYVTVQQQRK